MSEDSLYIGWKASLIEECYDVRWRNEVEIEPESECISVIKLDDNKRRDLYVIKIAFILSGKTEVESSEVDENGTDAMTTV